jgi:hypothetical protein
LWRCLGPLPSSWKKETPKKEAVYHVVGGVNDVFAPAVLGRGLGAREMQLDVVGKE